MLTPAPVERETVIDGHRTVDWERGLTAGWSAYHKGGNAADDPKWPAAYEHGYRSGWTAAETKDGAA